ncbi:MAG: hybrid sensor histidine kinase/response regulator [Deltaproteobacteria bacterium]|nr:hybrid sensor histidine kinase/response regulator [Deltaproteobacteria bacterium]
MTKSEAEMGRAIRILILEDQETDAALIEDELQSAEIDHVSYIVSGRKEYLEALDHFNPDIILSDYHLPQYDGLSALDDARLRLRAEVPFILVTGAIAEELAIDILIKGANDYVMKNRLQRLGPAVRRALEEALEIRSRKEAEDALRKAHDELEMLVVQRTAELQGEIEERKKTEESLREALARIKTLSGLLPICASCKKIRDKEDNWVQIESYIRDHSEANFTHGVCPDCAAKLYPKAFNIQH